MSEKFIIGCFIWTIIMNTLILIYHIKLYRSRLKTKRRLLRKD